MLANLCYVVVGNLLYFFLPGSLLALGLVRSFGRLPRHEKVAVILGFSCLPAPAVLFLVAALTLQPIGPLLAGGCALFLLLLLGRRAFRAATSAAPGSPPPEPPRWFPYVVAAVVFFLMVLVFDTTDDFDFSCTNFPCALPSGLAVASHLHGMPPFGQPAGLNTSLLFAGHQRMGIAAVLSPSLVLFGLLGLRIQWGLIYAFISIALYSLTRRLGLRAGGDLATALVCILPCMILKPDQNRLVLAMTCFLALSAVVGRAAPLPLGALTGLLFGMEPLSLLGLGALAPFWARGDRRPRRGLTFLLGLAAGGAPFMLRYWLAFGRPLWHEHFSYVPPIEYHVFGAAISLPAFLNWPINDTLVRSSYNPLPNLLLLPLAIERHLGVPLLAVVLVGVAALVLRRRTRALISTVLLFAPIAAALALNENWTQRDKWAIVVMAYLPVFLWLAQGLDVLVKRRPRAACVVGWLVAMAAIAGFHLAATKVDAPEDGRLRSLWSERVATLPVESSFYQGIERARFAGLFWLPGTFELRVPQLANMRALAGQLADLSFQRRQPSAAELTMLPLLRERWPAFPPDGVDLKALQRGRHDSAALGSVDFETAPDQGLTATPAGQVRTIGCRPGQRAVDLFPFAAPLPLRVPWNADPVILSLTLDQEGVSGLLLVIRSVPLADRGDFFREPVRSETCVKLHLPPPAEMMLIDLFSLDPLRPYVYRLFFANTAHDAPAATTLKYFDF